MAEEGRTRFGTVAEIVKRNRARKGKLTAFQVVLCREFMLDRNQTQAYLRAGGQAKIPDGAAAACFSRPAVRAEVARLEVEASGDYERRKQAVGFEKDVVYAEAKRNLMVAAGYEPITIGVKDDGTLIQAYRPDIGVVRLQLVDMARELGMAMGGKDLPTQNNNIFNFNGPNPFSGWTLEELAAWREEHRARLGEGKVVSNDDSNETPS